MNLQLSRRAVGRIAPLLLQGLCTRGELFEYLSTLEYRDGENIQREVDGYATLDGRYIDIRSVPLSVDARTRLANIARIHRLRGRKQSKQKEGLALEAILTGVLVPTTGDLTEVVMMFGLAQGRRAVPLKVNSEETPSPAYILRLSNRAIVGLVRIGTEHFDGIEQIGHIITRLASYQLMLVRPRSFIVYPRKRHDIRIPPWVIQHYVSEGQRLGLTPASAGKGGIRTSLSVASWVIELIGLGNVVPSHLAVLDSQRLVPDD